MSARQVSSKKTVYINYVDQIDQVRVKHLMAIISQIIAKENPDILHFHLASRGGDVDAGIALYNFLKSLPEKIIMHNIGSVDSIANVVFIAGARRYAAPHSTFLFHGVTSTVTTTPFSLGLPQVNEIRNRMLRSHDKIAGIICENTKIKEEEIKTLFREGETKDLSFALKRGIIHKIKLAQIPKGALFVSININ